MWRILKMKKYHQLLLLILSILSLIALLFYRHEYNKLRYVLEVLNFFGSPGGSSASSCFSQNVTFPYGLKLEEPRPAWQRVSNSLHIYSAFWDKVDGRNQVKAIALGTLTENLNYDCFVWFEEYEEPVKGQFSFSAIPKSGNSLFKTKTSKVKSYLFYCDPKEENSTPFGVTFYKTNNNDNAFIPILNISKRNVTSNTTGICTLPLETPQTPKTTFLEFLSFHHVLGVDRFVAYGGKHIHILLNQLEDPRFNVSITSLSWNYPFTSDVDMVRSIVEIDCLLRTRGVFANVVVLHWNQFIVPRFHDNINNLIRDLAVNKNSAKLQVTSYLFCLEYKDDPKSEAAQSTQLRKTRYTLPKIESPIFIHRNIYESTTIQNVSKEVVAIHWYVRCGQFDLKIPEKKKSVKNDYSFIKFNSDFLRSNIMKIPVLS